MHHLSTFYSAETNNSVEINFSINWLYYNYRELAFQLADQFRALGKPIGMKDAVIIGGLGTQ